MKKNSALLLRFLLLCVAGAFLTLTGPGAAFASSQPEKAPQKEEASSEKEGKPDKKKGGADDEMSGGRFDGDPIYVHVKPINVPVIDEHGVDQMVTVMIDLQVKDRDQANDLIARMPRVQDAILRALYGGLGNGTLRQGGMIDISKAKAQIARTLYKAFNAKPIEEVLVQAVAQRRL